MLNCGLLDWSIMLAALSTVLRIVEMISFFFLLSHWSAKCITFSCAASKCLLLFAAISIWQTKTIWIFLIRFSNVTYFCLVQELRLDGATFSSWYIAWICMKKKINSKNKNYIKQYYDDYKYKVKCKSTRYIKRSSR